MKETSSLNALFNPGEATDFFQIGDLPKFDPGTKISYSRGNALWLSETSRLVYHQDTRSRRAYFQGVGLEETRFFEQGATRAALVAGAGFAILAFRGTLGLRDVLSDLDFPAVEWNGPGLVHQGFKRQLDAVWEELSRALDSLNTPIFYTGHSLGAALATLAAARRAAEKSAPPCAIYDFGSPRVGTSEFVTALPDAVLHCRMVDHRDVVPTLPPRKPSLALDFHHVGTPFLLGPGGNLMQGILNEDPAEPMAAPDMSALQAGITEMLAGKGTSLFERLIDHAPLNYTARIEQARAIIRS